MMPRATFWNCIEERTKNHCPIVAEFELPEGMNLSKNLLEAVECL